MPPLPLSMRRPPRVVSNSRNPAVSHVPTPSRRIFHFCAGVFGMNLLSGWEEQPLAFWSVTGGIYGCIVLSIGGTVALCRRLSLL